MAESKRGFASMDEEQQKEIASKGGKAAQEEGTAHKLTPEEREEGAKKGGETAQKEGTAHKFTPEEQEEGAKKGGQAVSEDKEHMAEIGKLGGEARRGSSTAESKGSGRQRGGTSEQHSKAGQESHKE
jgi:general stress protein YciG